MFLNVSSQLAVLLLYIYQPTETMQTMHRSESPKGRHLILTEIISEGRQSDSQAQLLTIFWDALVALKFTVHMGNGGASLGAQLGKNPPAMWETWVPSLGWEDPLKGKATHSSILAWRIPWTICIVQGVAKSRTRLNDFHLTSLTHNILISHYLWEE